MWPRLLKVNSLQRSCNNIYEFAALEVFCAWVTCSWFAKAGFPVLWTPVCGPSPMLFVGSLPCLLPSVRDSFCLCIYHSAVAPCSCQCCFANYSGGCACGEVQSVTFYLGWRAVFILSGALALKHSILIPVIVFNMDQKLWRLFMVRDNILTKFLLFGFSSLAWHNQHYTSVL